MQKERGYGRMQVGLVVNPIAGMGGAVGLRGTDGNLQEAISLGARMSTPRRVRLFLRTVKPETNFITCPAEMGSQYLDKYDFKYESVSGDKFEYEEEIPLTTSQHTLNYLKQIIKHKPKLIIFAGGDGTARDVYSVTKEKFPILGIPCGVKVFSSVFAASPLDAAELTNQFLAGEITTRPCEVMDIDENAYRQDQLDTQLYGYADVPYTPTLVPGSKIPTPVSEEDEKEAIADAMAKEMEDGLYIMGPGTTVGAIMGKLKLQYSLLGVDLIKKKGSKASLIKKDANEQDLLTLLQNKKAKIIVSPLGHQGFIFGRGNQQISAKVLSKVKKEDVIIISTRNKLEGIEFLRIDVNVEINKKFGSYIQVVLGYHDLRLMRLRGTY